MADIKNIKRVIKKNIDARLLLNYIFMKIITRRIAKPNPNRCSKSSRIISFHLVFEIMDNKY